MKKMIFFEVDVQYLEKLHELHNDLPFYMVFIKILLKMLKLALILQIMN